MEYRVHRLDLKVGETLVIYSDGITEAMNGAHEQYETDRMVECLTRTLAKTSGPGLAEECVNDLRVDVDKFRQGAEVNDDLTVICLQRLPQ
mgnify:CR=1 FL=1